MAAPRRSAIPVLKAGVWIAALVPLGILAYRLFSGSVIVDDPVEEIQHRTGISTLVLLFLTLSVTPLRRLTGWNRLVRFRRLLGLFAFFYASLHAFSYFVFDQELSPSSIAADVAEHPWVLVGFTAFVLLIPLAVTSTNGWIRRLGAKRWARLHMIVYPIPVLGVLHFLWLVKADVSEPLAYGAVLSAILAARLFVWWSERRSRARISPRAATPGAPSVAGPPGPPAPPAPEPPKPGALPAPESPKPGALPGPVPPKPGARPVTVPPARTGRS